MQTLTILFVFLIGFLLGKNIQFQNKNIKNLEKKVDNLIKLIPLLKKNNIIPQIVESGSLKRPNSKDLLERKNPHKEALDAMEELIEDTI